MDDIGFIEDAPAKAQSEDVGFVPDDDIGFVPDEPTVRQTDQYDSQLKQGPALSSFDKAKSYLGDIFSRNLDSSKEAASKFITDAGDFLSAASKSLLPTYTPEQKSRFARAYLGGEASTTQQQVDEAIAPVTSQGGKIAVGAAQGAFATFEGAGQFLTSPIGLLTLGVGHLPATAQRGVALLFAADMARHTPETARQLGEAYEKGDTVTAAKLATEGVANALMSGMAAAHGVAGVKADVVRKWSPETATAERPDDIAVEAEVTPVVEAAKQADDAHAPATAAVLEEVAKAPEKPNETPQATQAPEEAAPVAAEDSVQFVPDEPTTQNEVGLTQDQKERLSKRAGKVQMDISVDRGDNPIADSDLPDLLKQLPKEVTDDHQAHGLSKGTFPELLDQLHTLVTKGPSDEKVFHSGPLVPTDMEKGTGMLNTKLRSPLVLVSEKGEMFEAGKPVRTVIVNETLNGAIPELRKAYPAVRFIGIDSLSELGGKHPSVKPSTPTVSDVFDIGPQLSADKTKSIVMKTLANSGIPAGDLHDAFQDVAERAIERQQSGTPFDPAKGSFEGWVSDVARSYAADRGRKSIAEKRGSGVAPESLDASFGFEEDGDTVGDTVADKGQSVTGEVTGGEQKSKLDEAVATLTPREQEIARSYMDGGRVTLDKRVATKLAGVLKDMGLSFQDLMRSNVAMVNPWFTHVGSIMKLPGVEMLNRLREKMVNSWKVADTKDVISGKVDAADAQANIVANQAGNKVRLLLEWKKADMEAMPFVIEAGGDLAKLAADAAKIKGKGFDKVMDHAIRNFDRLTKLVPEIDAIHADQLADERGAGMSVDEVESYVAHRFDTDLWNGGKSKLVLDATGGKGGGSSFFKKQRVFDTYADAIEAGYKPKTLNVADLVEHRVRAGQRLINQRAWVQSLRGLPNPIDGKPVVTELLTQPKGTKVPPRDYVAREVVPGTGMVAVHETFSPILDALTGRTVVPKVLSEVAGGVKHYMLLLDTFHASRVMQKQLFATGRIGYGKGKALLEYSDADLAEAVKQKSLDPAEAAYAKANRGKAQELIAAGLNVGNVQDALYRQAVQHIPVVSGFNKWVFDKLSRGAMLETALIYLEKNGKGFPELSRGQLVRKTAREVNTYFGNLGRQGTFKSQSWRDMTRLIFLAPQWVEGLVRTEAGAAKQLAMAPIDLASGKGLRVGMLGKSVATGLLAYAAASQIINLMTTGKPTWDNPAGHKMDAFIPDVLGHSNGFWLSPFSVVAEVTHDVMRYWDREANKSDILMDIIKNKTGPLFAMSRDIFIGKDFYGRPLGGLWDRSKQASVDGAPFPLMFRSLMTDYKGSNERKILGSLGFKVEPVASKSNDIYGAARTFLREKGLPERPFTPSDYSKLNTALREGDKESAKVAYAELVKTKSQKTVDHHFSNTMVTMPFTGSKKTEAEFRKSLDREQLDSYNKALEERRELVQRFHQYLK